MSRGNLADCFLLSYWIVLSAELIGDRSFYAVSSLAMRFRPPEVYCGITLAFLCKMLVAVLCGRLLAHLAPVWTGAISTATFFATAACIWFKKPQQPQRVATIAAIWKNAAILSFCAVFFSEWADFGQISAAALVVKYNAPGPVWLGGSLALCTKGALAMTLGLGLRKRISDHLVRMVSITSCLVLGFLALFDLLPH